MRWGVYIDESGPFGEPHRVGAPLIVSAVAIGGGLAVGQAMAHIFPFVALPHATDLRTPTAWALACARGALVAAADPRCAASGREQRALCADLIAAIRDVRDVHEVLGASEMLRHGQPSFDAPLQRQERTDIETADAWLRQHHRAAWVKARQVLENALDDVRGLIRALHEQRAVSVVAAACRMGDSMHRAGFPDARRDHYLDLLEALLERLARVCSPDDEVDLHVCGRHVAAPNGTMMAMSPTVASQVRTSAQALVPPPVCTMRVHCVSRYVPGMHPELVLADFLSNHLLGHAASSRAPWGAVRAGWTFVAPLERNVPRHGGTTLPTIASAGDPRHALLTGAPIVRHPQTWRSEQAELWRAAP